ncbi:MAG: MarR family EPS-associated transcriptional regulator, partial [Sulfurimonas sp.]|uniref:MarR family EPS-associated transcriptional regulator n=1 Tax=Sulfurimonas sp. TaxID=2022749 RepID=UPI0028CF0A25
EELELSILRSLNKVTTQKTLADELGYSVGKINYVIKALGAKGLLKVENFYNNQNKKQYRYLLTPKGLEEKITLTQKFIERKKEEYETLQTELEMMKSHDFNIGINR